MTHGIHHRLGVSARWHLEALARRRQAQKQSMCKNSLEPAQGQLGPQKQPASETDRHSEELV